MALDRYPYGKEWKEISECQDEITQGRKLREYICSLQDRIEELESEIEEQNDYHKDMLQLQNLILKSKIFKEWLRDHDDKIYHDLNTDWSGLQGGV